MKPIHTAMAIFLLASALLFAAPVFVTPALAAPNAAAEPAAKKLPAHCDSACLTNVMNAYVAALLAHDPSQVPLAPHVEFVENTKVLHPGEGLWKTADGAPTRFQIMVPDPVSEQVGFMCVMRANNEPIQAAFRLKIRHGEIVAAEHLWAGNITPAEMKNLQKPRAAFLEKVPLAKRSPRAKMIAVASTYYTAVTTADANNAPFASDCVRRENGMQTTSNPLPPNPTPRQVLGSLGCGAQLKTHVMDYIKRIEPRRVMIADPETGVVVGFSQFRHPMKEKTEKIVGVPGITSQNMNFKPFDNVAVHFFKISGGKIHEIEALGHSQMPYDCPTGWENFPDHGR